MNPIREQTVSFPFDDDAPFEKKEMEEADWLLK